MWFKNLFAFRLTAPFEHSPEALGAALAPQAFRPCGGMDPFTFGWDPPLGQDASALAHAAGGRILVSACREERILPASVVNDAAAERVAEIEAAQQRPVRAKERRRIKDDVFFTLLPRAFTRRVRTGAYLSPADGWLLVDGASPRRAEELVVLLGRSLDGLDVEPWSPPGIADALTGWVANGSPPKPFTLQHDCELRDPGEDGAVVRCQRQDLTGDEISAHLRAGKQVRRVALGYEDRLSLVLTAEGHVKRLRFEAVDELDDMDEADAAARLDANFAFMTAELAPLLARLLDLFGEGG